MHSVEARLACLPHAKRNENIYFFVDICIYACIAFKYGFFTLGQFLIVRHGEGKKFCCNRLRKFNQTDLCTVEERKYISVLTEADRTPAWKRACLIFVISSRNRDVEFQTTAWTIHAWKSGERKKPPILDFSTPQRRQITINFLHKDSYLSIFFDIKFELNKH